MGSSDRLRSALLLNHEVEKREDSFNREIRDKICEFLSDKKFDFLIFVGSLVRIVTALKHLNRNIDHCDRNIHNYLNYENQIRLFADQITLDEESRYDLLICEVSTVVDEEYKNQLKRIIERLEKNRGQKVIFVNLEKITVHIHTENLGRGKLIQIDELKRVVNLEVCIDFKAFEIDKIVGTKGYTRLHQAAYYGNTEEATTLIRFGANINAPNDYNSTPLQVAIFFGNEETAKALVDLGADLNTLDYHNKTALDLANEKSSSNFVKYLKSKGAKTSKQVTSA